MMFFLVSWGRLWLQRNRIINLRKTCLIAQSCKAHTCDMLPRKEIANVKKWEGTEICYWVCLNGFNRNFDWNFTLYYKRLLCLVILYFFATKQ